MGRMYDEILNGKKMSEFYEGMAEIFELDVGKISSDFDLNSGEAIWDSLAIVSTIALADDCFGVILEGKALGECQKISDIEILIAQTQKG